MRPMIDRLMDKVEMVGDCWVFTGCRHTAGYGVIGRGGKRGGMAYAHRVTYEFFIADIPEELQIDHLCRNRACCNPWHLEPVTRRVNLIRGEGVAGLAARATQCPQGHPYDESNTGHKASGARYCKQCNRQRVAQHRAQKRAAA